MKRLGILVAICCCAVITTHAKIKNSLLVQEVKKQEAKYEALYQDLHQHPELSKQEERTSALLAGKLRELGFEVTEKVGGYGIVGLLRNSEGPTIALRTDMDALPIQEATGLPYTSQTEDVFHACGHDMHMSVWLGTLETLATFKSHWKGTLVAIGQPAEEQNYGAQAMIKDGLFSRFPCPDYILAYHVSPEYPAGSVGYSLRETFAGLLNYDITFRGVGAHGAKPNTGIDPIVMASEAVLQFQTIPSRSVSPLAPSVVTVGSFHAGKVWNIIPEEATLQLTTRFYDMEVQKLIDKRIREICQGIAISNGVPEARMPEIKPLQIASPVINDTPLAEAVSQSMRDILGDEHLIEAAPSPVSEDFAYYSQTPEKVRTMIFWLGVTNPQKLQEATLAGQLLPQLHNECFAPQFADSWATGVQAMAKALIDLLQ